MHRSFPLSASCNELQIVLQHHRFIMDIFHPTTKYKRTRSKILIRTLAAQILMKSKFHLHVAGPTIIVWSPLSCCKKDLQCLIPHAKRLHLSAGSTIVLHAIFSYGIMLPAMHYYTVYCFLCSFVTQPYAASSVLLPTTILPTSHCSTSKCFCYTPLFLL